MSDDPLALPDDLPRPRDDGAADHLHGARLPPLALPSTSGERVRLDRLARRTVVYVHPRMARPGEPSPPGWDLIPGARGCTPESCGFRDHHADIDAAGADVYGLSTQATDDQREAVNRLALPFALLSDSTLDLTRALRLPTFETGGMTLIRRLTLVVLRGTVEHVFYPVFPPDAHAAEVLAWLHRRRS